MPGLRRRSPRDREPGATYPGHSRAATPRFLVRRLGECLGGYAPVVGPEPGSGAAARSAALPESSTAHTAAASCREAIL